jgi:glyoxylase-like metal-dependent hydrolase (beta-lactamase superfamily II)
MLLAHAGSVGPACRAEPYAARVAVSVSLAPGVLRIPVMPMDLLNVFALIDDDGQVTLVDAGVRRSPPRILQALAEIGSAAQEVTRILVTHSHADHVGGLGRVVEQTGADVAAHIDDADDVRLGRGAPLDPSAPLARLRSRNVGSDATPVETELHDGDVLPVAGGVRVIHTPGHTPGHVSLLHEPTGTLITGDAIWNMNARRTWPVMAFCSDGALSQQTANRLGELEYSTAAFTHGPEIRENGREAIRSFLARPRGFRMLL